MNLAVVPTESVRSHIANAAQMTLNAVGSLRSLTFEETVAVNKRLDLAMDLLQEIKRVASNSAGYAIKRLVQERL